ncbi:hypothetical protein [Psychrobacter sp.]|uniref:hypothetical protein n=1 Tax=Psychrobacter sp. TaxID=56811 RepID=UPI003567A992
MNNSQMEQLFFQLLNAQNEIEVEEIISNNSYLENNDNWKPYGGNRNNFGTFENQQNNPIPALVEKITNSIDACLMKRCHENSVNPVSSDAPNTMYEAVQRFYGIKDCNMNDLTDKERREIAEDIQVIATGEKGQPNIRIYDNGEGQLPEKFEETLLSLHRGNKVKIPFAQGKYNMGSTGAVVFCGDKKYQLIGSKRANDSSAKFGFTLVRKHPLTPSEKNENYRSTWYEYFTIEGNIPSFNSKSLDLGLKHRNFETGTIIQLYSFQPSYGNKGNISTDLYRSFNHYFYDLPLPFLVYETRYDSKINNKVIKGNRNRIDDDTNNNVENTISLALDTNLNSKNSYFEIPINITVFKIQPDNEQDRQYIGNKNLIFTLNGQVHGFEGQTFISKDLGFPLLKRCTLISVDCNYLPVDVMQELFMSNRTHLKQGKLTERLRKEVVDLIKDNKTLKIINEKRKKDLIGKSGKEKFDSVIDLLPSNSEVFDFLKKDSNLPFSKVKKTDKNSSDIKSKSNCNKQLKRFPSQFKLNLKEDTSGRNIKTIPLNKNGYVDIKTDVNDDYLFRSSDAGELNIDILQKSSLNGATSNGGRKTESTTAKSITVNRSGPSNGNIRLDIKPTEEAKAGDEVDIKVSLSSPSEEFTCRFTVRVDEKIVPPRNTGENKNNKFPNPPIPIKVYENLQDENEGKSWDDYNWDGNDVVKVIGSSDDNTSLIDAIAINMDSYVLKDFMNKNKYIKENDIERIANKYFQLMYTHSLGLYSICTKMQDSQRNKSVEEDRSYDIQQVDDFISSLVKPYASFLLYMDLHNDEIMRQMSDED